MTAAAPTAAHTVQHRHGSAVAWCGWGVLVLGGPGSGKSSLVTGLLAAGAYLVADDLVALRRQGQVVLAAAVAPVGLIELRGNGIFRLATTSWVPVNLCVELDDAGERLPERRTMTLAGVEIPILRLRLAQPQAVAAVLVALASRRVS
jgi:serine kinase of HPr protein (carbohydrate metabolism regulator)